MKHVFTLGAAVSEKCQILRFVTDPTSLRTMSLTGFLQSYTYLVYLDASESHTGEKVEYAVTSSVFD